MDLLNATTFCDELILHILEFLDPVSLARFREINSRAKQLGSDDLLWRSLFNNWITHDYLAAKKGLLSLETHFKGVAERTGSWMRVYAETYCYVQGLRCSMCHTRSKCDALPLLALSVCANCQRVTMTCHRKVPKKFQVSSQRVNPYGFVRGGQRYYLNRDILYVKQQIGEVDPNYHVRSEGAKQRLATIQGNRETRKDHLLAAFQEAGLPPPKLPMTRPQDRATTSRVMMWMWVQFGQLQVEDIVLKAKHEHYTEAITSRLIEEGYLETWAEQGILADFLKSMQGSVDLETHYTAISRRLHLHQAERRSRQVRLAHYLQSNSYGHLVDKETDLPDERLLLRLLPYNAYLEVKRYIDSGPAEKQTVVDVIDAIRREEANAKRNKSITWQMGQLLATEGVDPTTDEVAFLALQRCSLYHEILAGEVAPEREALLTIAEAVFQVKVQSTVVMDGVRCDAVTIQKRQRELYDVLRRNGLEMPSPLPWYLHEFVHFGVGHAEDRVREHALSVAKYKLKLQQADEEAQRRSILIEHVKNNVSGVTVKSEMIENVPLTYLWVTRGEQKVSLNDAATAISFFIILRVNGFKGIDHNNSHAILARIMAVTTLMQAPMQQSDAGWFPVAELQSLWESYCGISFRSACHRRLSDVVRLHPEIFRVQIQAETTSVSLLRLDKNYLQDVATKFTGSEPHDVKSEE